MTSISELSTAIGVEKDHDHFKWLAKVFSLHYKVYFGKHFQVMII